MIRVAICEDEPNDRAHLCALLAENPASLEVAEYSDGEPLVWDIETGRASFDLYLLDIYLRGADGISIARQIRALEPDAVLVFVTSSDDFYRDAYDLFAFNYLLKPVSRASLERVLSRALDQIQRRARQLVRFSYRSHTYVLRHSEIDYISSENRMVVFHLKNGETRRCYGKLDEFAQQLRGGSFVRCHQSYFVNLNCVTALEPGGFRVGDTLIPISRACSDAARTAYSDHLFHIFEQESE